MALPKKLEIGFKYVGPDYYGCINTGVAPAILHSKWLSQLTEYKYAVGPEVHLIDCCKIKAIGKSSHKTKHILPKSKIEVHFFKTFTQAKKYYLKLLANVIIYNKKEREHSIELRKRALQGDINFVIQNG